MKKWEYGLVVFYLAGLSAALLPGYRHILLWNLGILAAFILLAGGVKLLCPLFALADKFFDWLKNRIFWLYWFHHASKFRRATSRQLWQDFLQTKPRERHEWRHELDRELVQRFGKR